MALSIKSKPVLIKRPLAQANELIRLWRMFGPANDAICLESVIRELVNSRENPNQLTIQNYALPNSIDGAMVPIKDNQWAAIVNSSIESLGRRKFTLAHELFHFIAHRELQNDFNCSRQDINSFEGDSLEDDANAFASQLLIPSDFLRELDSQDFCYDVVKDAADSLAVSVTALAYKWVRESSTKSIGFFQSRDGFVDKGRASTPAYRQGVFFKSGTELPRGCLTVAVHNGNQPETQEIGAGVWSNHRGCNESVHQTTFEDYTYTFLDFK